MTGPVPVPPELRRAALNVLALEAGAGERTIHRAYRRIARECHPDHHPGNPEPEARFRLAAEAYEILTRPRPGGRYRLGKVPGGEPRQADSSDPSGSPAGSAYARWWRDQWADLI
jgi:curved DNA-binding protein CbpA